MNKETIDQIRQLLKERIAVAKVSADNENYLIKFSIKDAESILTLLPCEICGGYKWTKGEPCSACEKKDSTREVSYGIAQDDGRGGFGFWAGPVPSLEEILLTDGRDTNSVVWRFNADGTDDLIYRWACGLYSDGVGRWELDVEEKYKKYN